MAISKEDEAGTIYEHTSKAGTHYLKLTIKGQKFIAYRNKFKEQDKHPDWKVYIDKPQDGGAAIMPTSTRKPVSDSDIGW